MGSSLLLTHLHEKRKQKTKIFSFTENQTGVNGSELVSIHKWPFSAIPASTRRRRIKLRVSLCDVLTYVSAQPLVFLDLAKNCSFMNWKPVVTIVSLMDGHELTAENSGR